MKFTFGWLKDHLELDPSLENPLGAVVEKLSMIGLEVEGVEDRAADLAAFTVGYVTEAKQHPNADRLRLCLVDTGSETVQVVCGAPNARTGMKGVFAPVGTTIPGTGLHLKKGKIRGEESNGMLCSMREMGLSDEHEGIIELPEDAPVGAAFAQVMGLDEPVIEIGVTPNRPDCLGVRGIARDLAAAGLGTLKPLDDSPVEGSFDSPVGWQVDLPADKQHLAPIVVGRAFRGLKNGASPKWMQDRLTAVGLRPISALVDITNYVMLDLGRPLHAYDAEKLESDVIIRLAREGESYLALNGKTYHFDTDMLVIGDSRGPDDLAGIMGGEKTGCDDGTTTMFLEVAIFDPVSVATTGRKLGIHSDARHRFERGLDHAQAFWGAEVATRLILEICGGEASHLVVHGEKPKDRSAIGFRPDRVAELAGVAVDRPEQKRILEAVGCRVDDSSDPWQVVPPHWRPDIEGEACIVEEVARINGYERIEPVSMPRRNAVPSPALDPQQRRVADARRVLAARGMAEAVTFSFLAEAPARLFGWNDEALRLVNPISTDLSVMRPSILPNLIDAARRNADRATPDAALFEVGPQYADDTAKGQATVAAGIRLGAAVPRHWQGEARPADLFDAKADALAVLEQLGAPVANLQTSADAPGWYHPGRSGCLRLGPNVLARFGAIHPAISEAMEVDGALVAFEVLLDAIPPLKRKSAQRPLLVLPPLQPVQRDFAFLVSEDVPSEDVLRAARGADKGLIVDARLFDVYRGQGVADGEKSLAITVTLQPGDASLTEKDLEAVADKVTAAVAKRTGGRLRG